MEPRIDRIKFLMEERDWNKSDLARHMGVSKSVVTRMLQGERSGGNKTIEGLYRAFPSETKESLFILAGVYPNVNTNDTNIDIQEHIQNKKIKVKHPKAHQLACTIEKDGGHNRIDIRQGKLLTTLYVPPGDIVTEYKTE